MENTLRILNKIIPDEMIVLEKRFEILKGIQYYQPIGRRQLSQLLEYPEKTIRKEVDYLKTMEYIFVTTSGMTITEPGIQIVSELELIMCHLKGLTGLAQMLKKNLECQKVIIVPGNVDVQDTVKADIGKAASKELLNNLEDSSIVSLTGGSTVYNVVHMLKDVHKKHNDVLILPGRGSLRNNVEYQANSLAAELAKKIGAEYKLLNIPDNLSRKALESVRHEPEIQEILSKIINSNIILYGIGNAKIMAERRSLPGTVIDFLERKEAISEALGYYFNKSGEIVYTSRSIGLKLEHITKNAYPIAVVGGASKAESVIAVKQFLKNGCLVIDEGAAKEIIRIFNS